MKWSPGTLGTDESIAFLWRESFFFKIQLLASLKAEKHMEMRYENGLGLHVSIKHVNTLIKSLNLMRFIPMNMFYSYNSFFGHCSKCQINCEKGIKKRHN